MIYLARDYSERLAWHNRLPIGTIWAFSHGMMHDATHRWWDGKDRRGIHYGVDICDYLTPDGTQESLRPGALVLPVHNSIVRQIIPDYIGSTLFLDTGLSNDGWKLYNITAHVNLVERIRVGSIIDRESVVARIADPSSKGLKTPPHFHLSLAWIPKNYPVDKLGWDTLGSDYSITMVNPLTHIKFDAVYNHRRY